MGKNLLRRVLPLLLSFMMVATSVPTNVLAYEMPEIKYGDEAVIEDAAVEEVAASEEEAVAAAPVEETSGEEEAVSKGSDNGANIEIGDITAGYSSISVVIKSADDRFVIRVTNAETNETVNDRSSWPNEEEKSENISELFPGTKYIVSFLNYNNYSEELAPSKEITTKSIDDSKVEITAKKNEYYPGTINLSYKFDVGEGASEYDAVRVRYEISDSKGFTYTDSDYRSLTENSTFTYEKTVNGLSGDEEYTVSAWITEGYSGKGKALLKTASEAVTPNKKEAASFKAAVEPAEDGDLKVTITEKTNISEYEDVYVYGKANNDFMTNIVNRRFDINDEDEQVEIISLSGLEIAYDMPYTFWIVCNGVCEKIEDIEFTSDTVSAKCDISAGYFDAMFDFALQGDGLTSDRYYLSCNLYEKGNSSNLTGYGHDLYSGDDYRITNIPVSYRMLKPNTEYGVNFKVIDYDEWVNIYSCWAFFKTGEYDESLSNIVVKSKMGSCVVSGSFPTGCASGEYRSANAYCTIKKGNEVVTSKNIYLYVPNNETEWKISEASVQGLEENTEYEAIVSTEQNGLGFVFGKGTFTTLPDTRVITVSDIVNIGGFKLNIEVSGFDVDDYSANVTVAYRKKGEEGWYSVDDIEIYKNNKTGIAQGSTICYTDGYKTGDVIEYKVGFGSDADTLTRAKTGEVVIPEDTRAVEKKSEKACVDGAVIELELAGTGYDSLNVFYREKGAEDWIHYSSYGTEEKECTVIIRPYEATEGKEYEYVIGYRNPEDSSVEKLLKAVKGTFKIQKDDRDIKVYAPVAGIHKAEISGEVTGTASATATYLNCYYRVKGSEDWENCTSVDLTESLEDGDKTFKLDELTGLIDNTEYEYCMGLSNESYGDIEQFVGKKEGTFKTLEDLRTASSVKFTPGYEKADFSMDVINLTDEELDNYVKVYYRKKDDTSWDSRSYRVTVINKESTGKVENLIRDLEPGTVYEYVISFVNDDPEKIADKKKLTGSFTTKDDKKAYKVTATVNELLLTNVAGGLNIELSNVDATTDDEIEVTLTLSNGLEETVVLRKTKNYKETVVFKYLSYGTEYKVTGARFTVYETNSGYINLAEQSENIATFTTKSVDAPATIAILRDGQPLNDLYLNATGYGIRGVNYETPVVTITGDNVDRRVSWTSSDTNVCTVAGGTIYAQNAGEAVVTAKCVGNASLEVKINVHVSNLAVGYMDGDSFVNVSKYYSNEYPYNVYKGNELKNWGLYSVDSEGKASISGNSTVTIERPGIASYDSASKTIKAENPGVTTVVFEGENGAKAAASINVTAEPVNYAIKYLEFPYYEYGFEAYEDYSNYEAKKDENNESIFYLPNSGYSYIVKGLFSPFEFFNANKFSWESDKPEVASVYIDEYSGNAYITAEDAGVANITIKPVSESAKYKDAVKKITIVVQNLPRFDSTIIGVETHMSATLGDVDLSAKIKAFIDGDTNGEEKGWKWDIPSTSLYALPVNNESYFFKATYVGNPEKKPEEDFFRGYKGGIYVYLSTINGINVVDMSLPVNQRELKKSVMVADNKDAVTLMLSPDKYGDTSKLKDLSYVASVSSEKGITLKENGDSYLVTAQSEGEYTITVKAKVGDKIIEETATNYTIKAVKDQLVKSIKFSSDNEEFRNQIAEGNLVKFDIPKNDEEKSKFAMKYSVSANTIDRLGNSGTTNKTELVWTSTDPAVATVTVDPTDSHKATIKITEIKGVIEGGHTVISVAAKDEAEYHTEFNFEVRDYAPRIEEHLATINTAFNYETSAGQRIAIDNYGDLEIAGVYSKDIDWEKTKIVTKDGNENKYELSTPVRDENAELYYYIVKPKKNMLNGNKYDLTAGKEECTLLVKTDYRKEPYEYPITIQVVNKPVVAKASSKKFNLFYLPNQGEMNITLNFIDKNAGNRTRKLEWEDNNSSEGNEFRLLYNTNSYDSKKKTTTLIYRVNQTRVNVDTKGKPENGTDTGKITLKYDGILGDIVVEKAKIATFYKKAKIVSRDSETRKAVTNVITSLGLRRGSLTYYDMTRAAEVGKANESKYRLYQGYDFAVNGDDYESNAYAGAYAASSPADISLSGNSIRYLGAKKSEKTVIAFTSPNWREDVTCKHSVKDVKPVATGGGNILFNTMYYSNATRSVGLKGVNFSLYKTSPVFSDFEIEAADSKAAELLRDDRLQLFKDSAKEFDHSEYNEELEYWYDVYKTNANVLRIRQNDVTIMSSSIPAGKYSYKITPHAYAADGTDVKLNTLKMKVNIINEPISVTVKAKGVLDLVNLATPEYYNKYANSVSLTNKWTGLDSTTYTTCELVGDYSDYFYMPNKEHVAIAWNGRGKLKAGQKYNLKVRYTVTLSSGEKITVDSNEFQIVPKQSTYKFKVETDKRSNLFVATEGMYRKIRFTTKVKSKKVPGDTTYYEACEIADIEGKLDVNGDGIDDAIVELDYDNYDVDYSGSLSWANAKVTVTDKDALLAGKKGVKYKIPVTIKLVGRDGIAKDCTSTITINVKR